MSSVLNALCLLTAAYVVTFMAILIPAFISEAVSPIAITILFNNIVGFIIILMVQLNETNNANP